MFRPLNKRTRSSLINTTSVPEPRATSDTKLANSDSRIPPSSAEAAARRGSDEARNENVDASDDTKMSYSFETERTTSLQTAIKKDDKLQSSSNNALATDVASDALRRRGSDLRVSLGSGIPITGAQRSTTKNSPRATPPLTPTSSSGMEGGEVKEVLSRRLSMDPRVLLDKVKKAVDKMRTASVDTQMPDMPFVAADIARFDIALTMATLKEIEEAVGQASLLDELKEDQAKLKVAKTLSAVETVMERQVERLEKQVEYENKRFALISGKAREENDDLLNQAIEEESRNRERRELIRVENAKKAEEAEKIKAAEQLIRNEKKKEKDAKRLELLQEKEKERAIKLAEAEVVLEKKGAVALENAMSAFVKHRIDSSSPRTETTTLPIPEIAGKDVPDTNDEPPATSFGNDSREAIVAPALEKDETSTKSTPRASVADVGEKTKPDISHVDDERDASLLERLFGKKKKEKLMQVRHAQGGVMSVAARREEGSNASVLSGGVDKSLILFDVASNRVVERWAGHSRAVTKVAFGATSVYSGDASGIVYRWTSSSRHVQGCFSGHDDMICGIVESPSGHHIVTGSRDCTVRLWDVERQSVIAGEFLMDNVVTDLKWIPEQHSVIQSSEDRCLRVWDTRTCAVVQTFPRCPSVLSSCDAHKKGNHFLTSSAGADGEGCEATLWDRRKGLAVILYQGHEQAVTGCCFMPAMRGWPQLVGTCGIDCTVRVWYTLTGKEAAKMIVPDVGAFSSIVGDGIGGVHCGSVWKDVFTMQLAGQSEQ